MFSRPEVCLSDVSELLVVFFRRKLYFFRPELCLSDLSCVLELLVVFFRP